MTSLRGSAYGLPGVHVLHIQVGFELEEVGKDLSVADVRGAMYGSVSSSIRQFEARGVMRKQNLGGKGFRLWIKKSIKQCSFRLASLTPSAQSQGFPGDFPSCLHLSCLHYIKVLLGDCNVEGRASLGVKYFDRADRPPSEKLPELLCLSLRGIIKEPEGVRGEVGNKSGKSVYKHKDGVPLTWSEDGRLSPRIPPVITTLTIIFQPGFNSDRVQT